MHVPKREYDIPRNLMGKVAITRMRIFAGCLSRSMRLFEINMIGMAIKDEIASEHPMSNLVASNSFMNSNWNAYMCPENTPEPQK